MGVKTLNSCIPLFAGIVAIVASLQANAQKKPPEYAFSPACQAFRAQVTDKDGKAEQFVVYKDGKQVFNWADGTVKKETPRQMWSVSKTLTSTLMATAIKDGKVKLDDPVAKYFPELANDKRVDQKNFNKIQVRDLLRMTSGFEWNESAQASIQDQSVLPFLYSTGYTNLAKAVSQTPFSAEPGKKWNYSSTNAVLQMAILRKVYGEQASDMPWNNLFGPLGLKSARFEKDRSGTYVGAAYMHMSAQDLVKVGQLYANDGVWEGKRILPEGWVKSMAMKPAPQSMGTAKKREDFVDKGPFSEGGFWLNTPVKGVGKQFPLLPDSVFFASGLFGQGLVVLPEQNMVIARTGASDAGVEPNYNEIIANAMKCFARNDPATPKGPPVKIPLKQEAANPFAIFEEISGFGKMLGNGSFTGMLAKQLCSCHFVSNLSIDECIARSPVPSAIANLVANIHTDEKSRSVTLYPRVFTSAAQAQFNSAKPREGCQMTYGQADVYGSASAKATGGSK